MDRVLQPFQERFKPVGSLLQSVDAPLVSRSSRLGSRVRGPSSATQLNDTAEDRHATNRAPAWIAGTRHVETSRCLLLESRARGGGSKPNERHRPRRPPRQDYSSAHLPGHVRSKLMLIPD